MDFMRSARPFAIAGMLAVVAPAAALAGVTFSIDDLGDVGGGARALEVLVRNDGAGEVRINAFSFALEGTGVDFLKTTTATTAAPYVFAGHSFTEISLGLDDLGFLDPNGVYRALDLYDDPADGFAVLAAGGTLSLGRVFYDATATDHHVTLLGAPDTEVNFVPPTAVPEPSAIVTGLAAAAAGLAGVIRRRRGRA